MTQAPPGTDADVVERARSQPERFADLFDRYYPTIHGYAARRLGRDLADDIAAETFLVAFDRRHHYDTARPDARPWLYGIAANLIARHGRAERRYYRVLARAAPEQAVDGLADAVAVRLDAAAIRGRLAGALATIAPPDREVLLLVAWAGLNSQEVAAALDIPAGTARSRLHRARTAMRRALSLDDPMRTTEVAP